MDKYSPPQIDRMLESMGIYIDTREQETTALRKRIQDTGKPCVRKALAYGDYSGYYIDLFGQEQSLEKVVAIERKMGLIELCGNFTSGRNRFGREFERAAKDGCHIHLLIENDSYETLFNGEYQSSKNNKYGSNLPVQSLIGSLTSWSIKYDFKVHFCKSETTGKLIKEVLHYELRNYLLSQVSEKLVV